jgi:signal transduction histidine kinase/CheY-like chemotaxis protein
MDPSEIQKRKLRREIAARLEAERLLEEKSRELYDKGQTLEKLNGTLEARVAASTMQLQRSNAMLRMLHHTVLMAAEVDTFDEALERCLRAIGEFSGWPLGHIYQRASGDADVLTSSGLWFVQNPTLFKSFQDITEETSFAKGVGLPGRIWERGAPVWIKDVTQDANFPRADGRTRLNVRCGFGFPVQIKGRVAAVLEFFSDEAFERDEQLLALLESMGEQVGRVLERQEAHRQQRIAREDADRANQAKSRFLANMSHEIRTPMNAILGLTELVLDGEVTNTQREYLSTVLASGESLLSLVNDILDLSKIEADAVTLERTVVNLHEIVFSVMRSMANQAHLKQLELLCSIQSEVPEFICGDKTRIQQILINLVGNAIKFTQQGEVELKIATSVNASKQQELSFLICDTGIGIAKEKQETIFQEFEQADASTTRQFGGTGLGLSIVSRLVGLMNGTIQIESVVGNGSKIGFSIPESQYGTGVQDQIPATAGPGSIYELDQQAPEKSLAGSRVLLLEGNERHQAIFADWITRFGGDVVLASAVSEVSGKLQKNMLSKEDVDFVFVASPLLDSSDGRLFKGFLRSFPDSTQIMLMLDSTIHWQDQADHDQLAICRHLRKPLNYAEVVNVIYNLQKIEKISQGSRKKAPDTPAAGPRHLRVLVAEDSVVNQKLAVAMLHKLGHEVVIVNHGMEALAAIEAHEFDLVLMDIQMPEMDGFEAVRTLRQSEVDTRLPVIALTANAMRGDREACLEAGMDAYLSKPIRLQRLADVIESVCHSQ